MRASPVEISPTQGWHTRSAEDALLALDASVGGLSTDEAQARLQHYGANTIELGGKTRLWPIILHQFTSPLIYVLLIVMVITMAIQHWADSIVIGAVVLLNAIIGFTQEYRAENAMQALLRLVAAKATVLRDGRRQDIDSRELVRGDVVFLESGDLVPSDIRLLQITHLEIDEALLTGESLPVQLHGGVPGRATVTGDQKWWLFPGRPTVVG